MKIKLQEVLWEVTPRCNKNCDYCGSAGITKLSPLSDESLFEIAKQINDYKVPEVNLTGGEPGTLPSLTLDTIIGILSENCKVKIITNGELFKNRKDSLNNFSKISRIGLSINVKEDLSEEIAADLSAMKLKSKTTVITNFGTHNIWFFHDILEYIKSIGVSCWQVQLTMGKYQLNKSGIIHLRGLINSGMVDSCRPAGYPHIVLADNLQACHECLAGVRSCGITYDGSVVACLSERSYYEKGFYKTYGNILSTLLGIPRSNAKCLKEIWETGFQDIRFDDACCRKCCRDFIEYPEDDKPLTIEDCLNPFEYPEDDKPLTIEDCLNPSPSKVYDPKGARGEPARAVLYGVVSPGNVYVYAVNNGESWSGGPEDVMVYGVNG
jgi:MoaA/NifB/PqqE/SkfB family radical SAM enzyme